MYFWVGTLGHFFLFVLILYQLIGRLKWRKRAKKNKMDKPMFLSDSLINDVETTGYVGEQIEDKIDVRERLLYRPDNYLLN